MQTKATFNQTNITNQLTGTNQGGVCFSLCLQWLTHDRSNADAINNVTKADYATSTTSALSKVQNVANQVPVDVVSVVKAARDNFAIGAVEKVVGRALPVLEQDLAADLGGGQYPVNLVWLMEPAGRGHVVGYDKGAGLYFDPNQGIFGPDDVNQLVAMRAQVADNIVNQYGSSTYTAYAIFSVETP